MRTAGLDILIDQMPPLLMAIVNEVVASCPGAEVVARDVPPADLLATVTTMQPDVVVLGNSASLAQEDSVVRLLAPHAAERRIVTLFGIDRGARLHEWRHRVTAIEQLSAQSLCDAIRGESDG